MTQEERQLLLKVLCAMLPYGIKFKADNEECIREIYYIKDENVYIREYQNLPYWIDTIKPYLRPMSRITDEEYVKLLNMPYEDDDGNYEFGRDIDWLNAHYFDYRNLIEKGLALEAPMDMYKNK